MPTQRLEGYAGSGFDTRYDEGECYVYVVNRATRVERQVTLYLPQTLRNYAEIADRPGNDVTMVSSGLVVKDFETDTIRDAIIHAATTPTRWFDELFPDADVASHGPNPRLIKLFEVDVEVP